MQQMQINRLGVSLAVFLLIFLCSLTSEALESQTGFAGKVVDICSEAPIIGAKVSIKSLGVSTITDPSGVYELTVSPGIYEVCVEAPNYIAMSDSLQKVVRKSISNLDFEMVPENSTLEQEKIIEAKLIVPQLLPLEIELKILSESERLIHAAPSIKNISVSAIIKVLMPDGSIQTMDMDEYLKGAVPKEMAPSWPIEALKAQAVAARCYAATASRHPGANVCTTTHCQAWSSKHYTTTDQAVINTHNVVATYSGSIIQAFYFARCNGEHTLNSEDGIWQPSICKAGGSYVPYCRAVTCNLHESCINIPGEKPCCNGYYGHGVGMCQRGAQAMANQGNNYQQILKHYYTGIVVEEGSDISIRIDDYSADPRRVETGKDTTLNFRFTNTGDVQWTFGAAATLRKPDETIVDLPIKPVTLDSGQQGSAQWTYTIDMEGSWDLVFGVWKESAPPVENSLGHTDWLTEYIRGIDTDCFFADLDCDNDVDTEDVRRIAVYWDTQAGDALFNPDYDFNNDNKINLLDVRMVAQYWGQAAPFNPAAPSITQVNSNPEEVIAYLQENLPEVRISKITTVKGKSQGMELHLSYDPQKLKATYAGLEKHSSVIILGPKINQKQGTVAIGAVLLGEQKISALISEILATIKFTAHQERKSAPKIFTLGQNFPNPFNPETWMPYQLTEPDNVQIKIYNISGQLIRTLDLGYKKAGYYQDRTFAAYWDGRNEIGEKPASGLYFYTIKAGNFTATRRMLLIE